MESEIRILSHGQGVSTQRNHITILKEHILPVKRAWRGYWYDIFGLCAEAVQLEGVKLKVFFRIDLTIGITIDNQQDETVVIYLLLISSTCSRWCFCPSSGAYHCNYSFWYCPMQHQPAATLVDNTRSCSYSDMFLMMGENIARNM